MTRPHIAPCADTTCPIRRLCLRADLPSSPRAVHADLLSECGPLERDELLMLRPGAEGEYARLKGRA